MGSGETSSHVVSSPRRLAAILAADIAGFSRLMGLDEEGTLARVKRIRREIIEPTLAEHQGRLIKTSGDGFLAMFESPLEAVRCAIVIQQTMLARNTSLSKQQWIQFRIGVNLGDVIVEPDDIFGDGVNIAARLESLAAPGEVYISGGVYEQVKNKLVCGYHSLGDEKLKNITDPVRILSRAARPGGGRAGPERQLAHGARLGRRSGACGGRAAGGRLLERIQSEGAADRGRDVPGPARFRAGAAIVLAARPSSIRRPAARDPTGRTDRALPGGPKPAGAHGRRADSGVAATAAAGASG